MILLLIIIIVFVWFFNKKMKGIIETKQEYNVDEKFIVKNRFSRWYARFYGADWRADRLNNIINFFDSSNRKIFKESMQYLVLYENKSILIYTYSTFWKYIKAEDIEDIRIEKDGKTTSLSGAIGGYLVAGGIGGLIGSVKNAKMTIHIITKGFDATNYSIEIKDSKNMVEISNLLFQLYKVE